MDQLDTQTSEPTTPSAVVSDASLGRVEAAIAPDEVLARVRGLSKRGKLPGFEAVPGSTDAATFEAAAYGKPFDRVLVGVADRSAAGGSVVRFELRWKPMVPALFAVVAAITVWPGVLLTDSLMNTWFGWYPNETWVTYAWYLPLAILPLPWAARGAVRKSVASSTTHARETIEAIAKAIGGRVVDG